ncbi:MAG: YceD family protein [Sphingopyxis sp.]|uniref:YceD family protein n=1 Tax=Sphingopyxis sp. TaxID=1908224 RepID=UPI002ABCE61A|nr:YceD family protein [Sphingopyxis sp.]MDZ3832078.1 YceD family protein [Sphingopyxis sp.]
MTPEFSHIVTLADAAQGRKIALEADADARARIAARLDLVALDRFAMTADLSTIAGGMAARGTVEAQLVQSCAATDLPVPATITEAFDLHFLREIITPAEEEEEVEISSEDCDILPLEGDRADLGETAVQTLSLALDPFPRHPDADRILAEKGVLTEEQAGPFGALAALRGSTKS